MPIEQLLRELFIAPTPLTSVPVFILSLLLAAVLGVLLGQAYVHFGRSLSNRRVFARNFLLLTVTTTLIISIVKSSLALSLGLVGALSIVRFRAAIKEPEELAYLFLAISVGLGLGAGQALVTVVALTIILVLIALRSLIKGQPDRPNLYLTISTPTNGNLTATRIMEILTSLGAIAELKRFDESPELLEVAFVVDFSQLAAIEKFAQHVRELDASVRISGLDDRGLNY
jgi:Domain of unknown function (DUF4956)